MNFNCYKCINYYYFKQGPGGLQHGSAIKFRANRTSWELEHLKTFGATTLRTAAENKLGELRC